MQFIFVTKIEALLLICMITSHYYNADTWHDIKNRGFEQYLTTRGSTG